MIHETFPSALASAKRKRNERAGIHSWHPYYAGYAEEFVRTAIVYLKLNDESVVLDPWSGSGTTQLVCAKAGIECFGFDVNPVMTIFTNAKAGINLEHFGNELPETLKALKVSFLKNSKKCSATDPLLEWMDLSLVSALRNVFFAIASHEFRPLDLSTYFAGVFDDSLRGKFVDCGADFFRACLFVTGRQLAKYAGGSNPTWTKASEHSHIQYTRSDVFEKYAENCVSMLGDIRACGVKEGSTNFSLEGDSRHLPIRDSSVDAVITSPPYLTRIDYAMSTQPEILLLEDLARLRKIRESTMGAPVIVDKNIQVADSWGRTCQLLLTAVANHETKAARSYYLPNMLQYFRDAELSLREILRVLKKGSKALIVVQSSYFKELEIDLGQIYIEIAEKLGSSASIASREVVKGHMAHVNSKSNGYKSNKVYFEDVVEVEKI